MEHTEKYQTLLESELDLVTEELKSLGVQDPHNPKDWVATTVDMDEGEADENVAADKSEELEEREAILSDLEVRFNAAKRALRKIEESTFGICEICQEPIEEDRLSANPAARTCKSHRHDESSLPN